jgi:ribosome-binding factor A
MSRRTERVEGVIREEVSVILQRELRDPGLGFVTVTGAEVSPDLRHARVFVSVLGTPEEKRHSLDALNRARGFLRTELSKRMRMRVVPELEFRHDEAAETGTRVFELLEEARRQDEDDAG